MIGVAKVTVTIPLITSVIIVDPIVTFVIGIALELSLVNNLQLPIPRGVLIISILLMDCDAWPMFATREPLSTICFVSTSCKTKFGGTV